MASSCYMFLAIKFILIPILFAEEFNRTTSTYPNPGSCINFPCTFNCIADSSCRETTISCGNAVNGGICIINLIGTNSGYQTTINTGTATEIHLNVQGYYSFYEGVLYANTVVGAKLYIRVTGTAPAFQYVELYSPYGINSLLQINCDSPSQTYNCGYGTWYDDYSTTVELYGNGYYSFYSSTISQQPGIIKSINSNDSLYVNYRAPVTLYVAASDEGAFQYFTYNTIDHGNWTLESHAGYAFFAAIIHAEHSFITDEHYRIYLYGSDNIAAFSQTTLYAAQNNAHIQIDAIAERCFSYTAYESSYYFTFIYDRPDMVLSNLIVNASNTYSLGYSQWQIDGNITGDVIFDISGSLGMYYSDIIMGNITIGGNVMFNIAETADSALQSSPITMNNVNINGNVTFNVDAPYGLYYTIAPDGIKLGNVNGNVNFAVGSAATSAIQQTPITIGDIGGYVNVYVGGNSGMYLTPITMGNIGKSATFTVTKNGVSGLQSSPIIMGNVGGDITFNSDVSYGLYSTTNGIKIGNVSGNVLFDIESNGYWAMRYTPVTIGTIYGSATFTMDGEYGMGETQLLIHHIEGDFTLQDGGATGLGFYNTPIQVPNGINGNVLFLDESIASGQVFYGSTVILGDIGGSLIVKEDGEYGLSFSSKTWTIGDVIGNVLFQSFTDNGQEAFSLSNFNIQHINGSLTLYSNSYRSFYSNTWNINNGIGGDITMVEISSGGQGFYGSFFNFYGVIGGSVSVRDQSVMQTGTSQSFYSTQWTFNTVIGNMEFIERSFTGNAFAYQLFNIDYVGGNLLFAAENENNNQAFDVTTWNIGTVNGNLIMYSNDYGAFSEGTIKIKQINGISMFTGLSNNDFYDTDFTINGSTEIIFNVTGNQAISVSNNYFGSQVGSVKLYVNGGTDALYQTNWDCRNCDYFELQCLNDADCGGISTVETNIYCPENNGDNKCMIYCDESAQCDYIDVFTTSGYCYDSMFKCLEITTNDCIIDYSRIFCTTNTAYNYGIKTDSYCIMKQNALNQHVWFCDDYGPSDCAALSCTSSPTITPTLNPITINPTTTQPTIIPTIYPTNIPTTFEPTTNEPTTHFPTTNQPTFIPTIYPTQIPSIYPTIEPTYNPITNNPTIIPTYIPSIYPTTNTPTILTISPSKIASDTPTNRPTNSNPSMSPTKAPFRSGQLPTQNMVSTIATDSDHDNNQGKGNIGDTNDSSTMIGLMVGIIIGLALLLAFVICVLLYIFCRRNNNEKKQTDIHKHLHQQIGSASNVIELGHIGSETDIQDGDGVDGDTNTTVIPGKNDNNNEIKQQLVSVPIVFGNDNALKLWLTNLGLSQYYNVFVEQGFDDQVSSLSEITENDLKEMGIKKIGHRRAIMKQVRLMKITVDADKASNNNMEGPQITVRAPQITAGNGKDYQVEALYSAGDNNIDIVNANNESDSEQLY